MCGLVGRIDLDGIDRDAVAPGLARALARLGPRGPDARGQWVDDRAALGHTRLAIIDVSPGGLQPMRRHGLAITYNGEIYNYRALRDALCRLGHRFDSDSDTEVVLAGWRQWGPALLPRLTGMFAFLLWDPARGQAVLARDRFGLKPLVYTTSGRRLAAASDLVALAAVAPWVGDLDPAALRLFFALRYIPDPWTIRPGARKLPPGHMAVFEDGRLTLSRWYDLRTARAARPPAPPPATPAEAAAELRRRVDAAVADRLVADVPVGAFLSGGIDSAIITAAMAARGIRPRTFTVGFAGASDYYEERPAARAVAEHLGTDHTDIELDPATALAAVPEVLAATDEPFADSSALPTWLLARETRAHVTVALSGDGADELFGGYRKHRGELWAARYQRLPALLRRGVIEPLAGLLPDGKGHPLREHARRLRRFVAHAGGSPAARQAGWARLLGDPDLDRLLGPAPDGAVTPEALVADRRGDPAADWNGDGINAMLAGEVGLGLAGDMLVKVDRMSMAHALEVRCPFTDQRVAEWAAALPGAWKLGAAGGKLVLRDAFRDRLPAAVFERPKKGFEVPIDRWLAGPLTPLLDRALDPGRLRRQGLVNPDMPAAWRAALLSGRRDTSWQLWAMLAFSHWIDPP